MARNNNRNNDSRRDGGNSGSDKRTKSTGCKAGNGRDSGKPWVSGWNKQKNRFVSILAFPYEGTSVHTTDKGDEYENWVAKVKVDDVPQPGVTPCLYQRSTGKVILKDFGYVMNPKAPNGGYCGKFTK